MTIHELLNIRDLISICAIKIEKPAVHIEKMKALAENRKLYNMKELSERYTTTQHLSQPSRLQISGS